MTTAAVKMEKQSSHHLHFSGITKVHVLFNGKLAHRLKKRNNCIVNLRYINSATVSSHIKTKSNFNNKRSCQVKDNKEAKEKMQKLIHGEITEASMEELRKIMPKKKLMVFVSSTFMDSNLERDILHTNILPDLEKKGQQHGVQVILYDMRFGVKDENTKDHMTWVSCKEAIQQCHEGSDGLYFLSLQADRYGYRPLPKYVDEKVLKEVVNGKDNAQESLELLKQWYILDENHCPPRYELKPLRVGSDGKWDDPEYWSKVLPQLGESVLDSVAFETCSSTDDEALLVNRSVTEWETLFGLHCDKDRCYWVHRSFDAEKLKAYSSDANYHKLTDGKEGVLPEKSILLKLDNLKAKMKSTLRADQLCELLKPLSPSDYFDETRCVKYSRKWEKVARNCLENELEKVIVKSVEWQKGYDGIPVDHLEEILHHCSVAFDKARNFFGREELIQNALTVLNKNGEKTETVLSGIALALVGRSGCGKTALMSKLALPAADANIPTIIRFCGTSKFSYDGLKLIQSISIQLLAIHGKQEELVKLLSDMPSHDYKTAVEYFQKLVSHYPVNLFIDSLDQLENRYEARSKLTFLRDIKPHEQSKVIVSTLPDEYDDDGKAGKYFYRCERTLKAGNVTCVEVGTMDTVVAVQTTIEALIRCKQRKLTDDQWLVTMNALMQEQTVLYINLAMEVLTQWRSFSKEVMLKPTVKGLINQIFCGLEKDFGTEFTSTALAFITFAREGVNDPEMQDLLTLHDKVMKEVCQYSDLHFFPMHVWLRLKYVVKNLVTEKESHCIRWYHRQLWETACERYSHKKTECHQIMGKYFTNRYDCALMRDKDIMQQPLVLNDVSIWRKECHVNRRRVIEGYYHLIKGELLDEVVNEICSLEFVCASGYCVDLFNLVRRMAKVVPKFNGDEDMKKTLDHYFRWIRKRANVIASNPSWMVRSTAGEEPGESEVRQSSMQSLQTPDGNWNICYIISCLTSKAFDRVEMDITCSSMVFTVSWNHDSSKIVSGSLDKTIKIWDAVSGESLNTLEGHFESVSSVSWNHDSSKIVSGSYDETIKIWDAVSGELLNTLLGHSHRVRSVSWNHDSSKVVSGSRDKTIKIWDAVSGELLNTLEGHSDDVISVSWNHDSSKIVSGSADKTINIWDAVSGELLRTLHGHCAGVYSVSWNHDSSKIVSGSSDKTIKIWDAVSGELLNTLQSHSDGVSSVSFNHDSSRIVSGSLDKTVRIWDAVSGDLLSTLESHSYAIYSVSWNHDSSKAVSGSRDKTIKMWDAVSGESLDTLEGHSESVSSVSWNHDSSKFVSGSNDRTMKIWDAASGELLSTLEGHSSWVNSVLWNGDSSKIVSGSSDKTIKIWDAVSGELLNTLQGHSDGVDSVSWNHDSSKVVSGSRDKTIKIWDAVSGELLNTLRGHSFWVVSVSWNHDSSMIVSGSPDNTMRVWDAVSGELLSTLEGHSRAVCSVSFNHDSSKFVSGSLDKTIKIWDAVSGELLSTLQGHSDGVISVSWSHDSSMIVSGSLDKTIKIWDAVSGELLNTLQGHSDGVISVSWSYDSSKIVSGSKDKTIKVLTL
jgi:WD40 repeat protein